ncbi:MAG TPA: hypothetical protein VFV53_05740 [Candidatus Limnocylindrales bacterium]|nr:hypothetical protein [Candidatus Limnocylindrales bacterium]
MQRVVTVLLGAAAVVGVGATIMAIAAIFPNGLTAGSDLEAYIDAGTAIRAGQPIYTTGIATGSFIYSPPWAVLFAPLSLFPGAVLQATIMALDVLVLRYVLGSWRAVGWMGLYPLTWYALASGNVDILIAGAIVAAWKHTSVPLAVMTFAKVSPAFALDVRRIREFGVACLILVAITIPWFDQWLEYARFLVGQPSSAGTVVPIPWFVRLPFALLLLLPRRPWTSALAAVVAIPLWFLYTSVILIAPLRLWLDERQRGAEAARGRLPAGAAAPTTPGRDIP